MYSEQQQQNSFEGERQLPGAGYAPQSGFYPEESYVPQLSYPPQLRHYGPSQALPPSQFPPAGATVPGTYPYPQAMSEPGMLPLEQSFIENILRFNRGKVARFYMTYENNPEWPARVFRGRIEEAGRDHIIVSSTDHGPNHLLLMVNLDYVEFDEPIDYFPPPYPGYTATAPARSSET